MGQTGFCENLRFSAVSCENLRFPAVFCENLRLPDAISMPYGAIGGGVSSGWATKKKGTTPSVEEQMKETAACRAPYRFLSPQR